VAREIAPLQRIAFDVPQRVPQDPERSGPGSEAPGPCCQGHGAPRSLPPVNEVARIRSAEPAAPVYSPVYLRYALGVLCLVYVVSFLDRQILAILLESIKRDLQLTDVQLGLLSGTAFGLFYATLGIPIARLADRVSRKGVIAVCLALWSLMTLLCGSARGFEQLFLYRVGVGVGEAGGGPPSHSLISDYFPPERRATALGVFAVGVQIGQLIGYLGGGWLDEAVGWRLAFVAAGAPGLVLALVLVFTLREPPRGHSDGLGAQAGPAPATAEVVRFLWWSRSFRHVAFAAALNGFAAYSVLTWLPAFLMRSHGMGTAEAGAWLALLIGVVGGVGSVLGGVISDRWARREIRSRVWFPGLAVGLALPFSLVTYMAGERSLALFALGASMFLGTMFQAPMFAAAQFLATPRMRATAAALLLFATNIVGLAVGPAATGALSDALAPRHGADSLAWALVAVSLGYGWAAYHLYLAGRTLEADLERVQRAAALA
jgi:MFS family permease